MNPNSKITLVPVADSAKLITCGIPYTPSTLRKLHHLKRYPTIFVKLGGRLFIDLEAWGRVVEIAKEETVKESQRWHDRKSA